MTRESKEEEDDVDDGGGNSNVPVASAPMSMTASKSSWKNINNNVFSQYCFHNVF